jgi:hypothetical protein
MELMAAMAECLELQEVWNANSQCNPEQQRSQPVISRPIPYTLTLQVAAAALLVPTAASQPATDEVGLQTSLSQAPQTNLN